MRKVTLVLSLVASVAILARAQTTRQAELRVESNVVYGMYSGLALLMDVLYLAATNGYGIIFVPETGFHGPLAYDAPPPKAIPAIATYARSVERWLHLVRCELSTCAPVPLSSSSRGCPAGRKIHSTQRGSLWNTRRPHRSPWRINRRIPGRYAGCYGKG
jgi:hypothetical protein